MIDDGLLPHLVEVESPGSRTDPYGNTLPDWTASARAPVRGWMQQESAAEDTDQRNAQISTWLLICNPWTTTGDPLTVHGRDRVHWGARRFEVTGPPGPEYEPGGLHHYEIQLREVHG
ncbi:hypothetical protein [Streptomyces sp. CAU 1734]|uniref:phage head completion protein n=1 Tax=Streptomyces sp. CAU 1734 TaxID=3140360 RepID=UPI0032602CB8